MLEAQHESINRAAARAAACTARHWATVGMALAQHGTALGHCGHGTGPARAAACTARHADCNIRLRLHDARHTWDGSASGCSAHGAAPLCAAPCIIVRRIVPGGAPQFHRARRLWLCGNCEHCAAVAAAIDLRAAVIARPVRRHTCCAVARCLGELRARTARHWPSREGARAPP
jgi:hypothetical protein